MSSWSATSANGAACASRRAATASSAARSPRICAAHCCTSWPDEPGNSKFGAAVDPGAFASTGIRVAAVYAPIGALIGEWVGASSGLGYALLMANGRAQTDVVFAALLLLAAMSVILRAIVDLLTRDLTPWAPETVK